MLTSRATPKQDREQQEEELARLAVREQDQAQETPSDTNEEPGQRRLKLASVVDRVRLAQKSDSDETSAATQGDNKVSNGTNASMIDNTIHDDDRPVLLPTVPVVPERSTTPSRLQVPSTSSPQPEITMSEEEHIEEAEDEAALEGGHRRWYSTLLDQFNYHRATSTSNSEGTRKRKEKKAYTQAQAQAPFGLCSLFLHFINAHRFPWTLSIL